jgi:ABC-type antimicrobial peptide transport system permease subunit
VAFRVRVWEVMSRGRGPRGECPPPEGVDVACPPGIVVALIFSRVMRSLLFETPVNDPITFAGVALMFLAVGFAASYVPARRVTKVDPLIALRSE